MGEENENDEKKKQEEKQLEKIKTYVGSYLLASLLVLIAIAGTVYLMHLSSVLLKTVLYTGVAGGIGGVFYGIRGFVYHNAEDDFKTEWDWWYIYQPVTGFIVGLFSYLLIVGGLLTLGTVSTADYSKGLVIYLPIAFLAGFATKKFNEKLDELASTLFSAGPDSATSKSPAPAVSLAFSDFPNPATAGTPVSFKVIAKNAKKKTAAGYTGTVAFTSDDKQAVLPPSYTFEASEKGVHKFKQAATFNSTGSHTITVTDSKDSTITGSQTVTVNPPPTPPPATQTPPTK
ncbi:MAG: hypothetical protein ABSG33_09315 [Candidatus Bathyarchaeia archaeon]|jgi:hypothetical protein